MSDAFADSFGINTRFAGGIYKTQRTAVENYLVELGFRHIRDGGIFLKPDVRAYLQSLCTRHGIHSSLLTNDTDSDAALLGYITDVPCLDMVEGPNELDNAPNWAARLAAFVPHLYSVIRSSPAYAEVAIVAPSITGFEHTTQLAGLVDVAKYVDFGNKHSYPSDRNIGGSNGTGDRGYGPTHNGCPAYSYGSYFFNICAAQLFTKDRPIWTTETGYQSTAEGYPQTGTHPPYGSIPYSVAVKYFPRLLAYEFLNGINRTYIMALVDGASGCNGPYNTDGLVEQDCPNTGLASSLHPKPAFVALKNLMATVSDPGPSFTPTPLNIKIGGGDPKLQTLLLQKRSGEYLLLYWVEASDWDVDKGTLTPVPSETFTITIPGFGNAHDAKKFGIDEAGNLTKPVAVRLANDESPLVATDSIQFLTLSAPTR